MAVGDSFQAAVDTGILDQLARVGEASAVIAAAVALIGLWLTLRDDRKRNREKDVLEWQKVIVFEIIANRGPIEAADITRFFDEKEFESLLKNKLLGSLALDSILLSLIADNAIMILPEEDSPPQTFLYSIVRAIHQARTSDTILALDQRSLLAAKDTREILDHIEQNNGKFTLLEFKEYLKYNRLFDDTRIESTDDILLRLEMILRMVTRDRNGKIWRLWPVVPPSAQAAPSPTAH